MRSSAASDVYKRQLWDFFRDVTGTISFAYEANPMVTIHSVAITQMVGSYALQIGDGANDKTSAFGASAWIQGPAMYSHHWDLNMDLTRVPLPSVIWLMGLGFVMIAVARRRR